MPDYIMKVASSQQFLWYMLITAGINVKFLGRFGNVLFSGLSTVDCACVRTSRMAWWGCVAITVNVRGYGPPRNQRRVPAGQSREGPWNWLSQNKATQSNTAYANVRTQAQSTVLPLLDHACYTSYCGVCLFLLLCTCMWTSLMWVVIKKLLSLKSHHFISPTWFISRSG